MEKGLNSYYGMAYNDYCYAKAGMQVGEQLGNYNGVAALCLGLMHSHNLRAIVNKLKEAYPNLELSTKDMKWLGDFYFDARYPGDNFIQVHKEDALECLRLTEDLQKKTTILLDQIERDKQQKKDIIQGLDSFEI